MKTLTEKHKNFLNDLVAVCKKHNLSLSHEDNQGAFLIDEYKQGNIDWLMAAMVALTKEEELEEFISILPKPITCSCGNPGKVREDGCWFRVYCDDCWENE